MGKADWLLSGIPRSGTSLCCRLLGDLPDTVALSEPFRLAQFDDLPTVATANAYIVESIASIRRKILQEHMAPSTHVAGRLDDSRVGEEVALHGLRQPQGEQGEILIEKELSAHFLLLVKHNALFAALLPLLNQSFSCIALVRNPLAVLLSWQTVALPVNDGRIPAGEKYAPELRANLDAEPDVLQRQLTILNWFFESYRSHLPTNRILKYEDLVASGGISLFAAVGRSDAEPVDLGSRNKSDLYAGVNVDRLLSTLVAAPGAWQHFYSIADCERLALEMGRAS